MSVVILAGRGKGCVSRRRQTGQNRSQSLEVFTNEVTGTLVVDDIGALTLAEQASAGEK